MGAKVGSSLRTLGATSSRALLELKTGRATSPSVAFPFEAEGTISTGVNPSLEARRAAFPGARNPLEIETATFAGVGVSFDGGKEATFADPGFSLVARAATPSGMPFFMERRFDAGDFVIVFFPFRRFIVAVDGQGFDLGEEVKFLSFKE